MGGGAPHRGGSPPYPLLVLMCFPSYIAKGVRKGETSKYKPIQEKNKQKQAKTKVLNKSDDKQNVQHRKISTKTAKIIKYHARAYLIIKRSENLRKILTEKQEKSTKNLRKNKTIGFLKKNCEKCLYSPTERF